jgi:hypothetical protein
MWQSNPTIRHEVSSPIVYLNDTPYSGYSRLGTISFFKMASGIRHGTYFGGGSEIALGNPAFFQNKIIVPWSTDIEYGVVGNRFGEVW